MCVDHGRLDVLMPEEALHFPDIYAVHKQMRGKAVAKGVDGGMFRYTRFLHRTGYGSLYRLLADVVTPDLAAPGVYR